MWRLGGELGANYRISSGLPITRSVAITTCSATITTNCVNQNLTVNAEPRGSVRLPALSTLDLRAGRIFNARTTTLELSMDVYNVANSNTPYSVRTGTGLSSVRYAGDPNATPTNIQMFMSPTAVLGPRIIRFNITYTFR